MSDVEDDLSGDPPVVLPSNDDSCVLDLDGSFSPNYDETESESEEAGEPQSQNRQVLLSEQQADLIASTNTQLLNQPVPKKPRIDQSDTQFIVSPTGLLHAANVAIKRVQAGSGGKRHMLWSVPRVVVTNVPLPNRPCTALCEAG